MATYNVDQLRFLVRGGLLSALKLATGIDLRPLERELTVATDKLSMRLGKTGTEYVDLIVLNPVAPSFRYLAKTSSTSDADPAPGYMKWNNATQGSATFLYFDDVTGDTGTDLSTFFASMGTTGFIHMVSEEDRSKWQVWKWTSVVDGTGYWKYAVTLQANAGNFNDGEAMRVTFAAQGGSSSGGMSHVGNATPSAGTTLSISPLDLGTDVEYYCQVVVDNTNAATATYSLFYNGDTTATNYSRQALNANGSAASAGRANDAILFSADGNETATGFIRITKDADGKARAYSSISRAFGSSLLRGEQTWQHQATAANVTSMALVGSLSNSVGANSIMRVYRIKP